MKLSLEVIQLFPLYTKTKIFTPLYLSKYLLQHNEIWRVDGSLPEHDHVLSSCPCQQY